ncbi:MAG: hypothetical protein WD603_00990 [Patescibacteria group bacterium]
MRDWGILIPMAFVPAGLAFIAGIVSLLTGSAFLLNLLRVSVLAAIVLMILFFNDQIRRALDEGPS